MLFCNPVEPLEKRVLLAHAAASVAVPRYDHVVIVVEENHNYSDILGDQSMPFPPFPISGLPVGTGFNEDPWIRSVAKSGVNFTNASAEAHPSEPNYLALFSGSTQGVRSDALPTRKYTAPSLGGQLIKNGFTFAGYSEDLPKTGSLVEKSGAYARKHNPWSMFADVPNSVNRPFSAFPTDFRKLPTVSFVAPNQKNDMHSGSIQAADDWLKKHMAAYAKWAQTHNSLLIVTWDEGSGSNHIATLMIGAHLKPGKNAAPINHYSILSTLETMYGLPKLGGKKGAGGAPPITSAFSTKKI